MFKFDETSAVETTGGNGLGKILPTGVYDVTIKTVSETTAGTGAKGIDISFLVDGSKFPNTVYGIWYKKSNGDDIAFNKNKINNLLGLAGGKSPEVYDKTVETKDGNRIVKAWKHLDDFKCKIAIRKVIDVYNGEEREKNEIEAFLGTDGRTYAEKVKNSDAKQIIYYSEKLKDKYTDEWKKANADGELNADREANTTEDEEGGSLL